jgi:hypothetical protein
MSFLRSYDTCLTSSAGGAGTRGLGESSPAPNMTRDGEVALAEAALA